MSEPTNADVLDAVTLELSRFTRDVVAEMHRLRDQLTVERERTDRLESRVESLTASLRKFDTQAARIVDHVTDLSDDVDRRLRAVEGPDRPVVPAPDLPAAVSAGPTDSIPPFEFVDPLAPGPLAAAPLDLDGTPAADPTPQTSTLDDEPDTHTLRPEVGTADLLSGIEFAPLVLELDPIEPDPMAASTADDIGDLVARVIGAIDQPPAPSQDPAATTERAAAR